MKHVLRRILIPHDDAHEAAKHRLHAPVQVNETQVQTCDGNGTDDCLVSLSPDTPDMDAIQHTS